MMKKTYIKPSMKSVSIRFNQMIAGSYDGSINGGKSGNGDLGKEEAETDFGW